MIKKTADEQIKETLQETPPIRPPVWWPLLILYGVVSFIFIMLIGAIVILTITGFFALIIKGIGIIIAWVTMG